MARVSLLQLDTHFPRIAGDVGCPETFLEELEVVRVPNASVANIVTDQPNRINLRPFLNAIDAATGDIITTSCGFLAPLQSQLQAVTNRPVIASALEQLTELAQNHTPSEISILTFDATKLGAQHLPETAKDHADRIVGLPAICHLREVIENDCTSLDINLATKDVQSALQPCITPPIQTLVIECTNLPPYKPAIRTMLDCPIYDILTAIERAAPNTIRPEYL